MHKKGYKSSIEGEKNKRNASWHISSILFIPPWNSRLRRLLKRFKNQHDNLQKIILGQTEGHFSTCSSLAIGLNLDKSTCWTQRRGAKNMCNARISLDSNRKCLDQVLANESLNSAQVDLFTLSIYTGTYWTCFQVQNRPKNVSFQFPHRNQRFVIFCPLIDDLKPFLCREDNADQTWKPLKFK